MAEYPALEIAFRRAADSTLLDRLSAQLDDFEPVAIHDDDVTASWRVFFRSLASRDAALAALGPLATESQLSVAAIDVPDEDWARRSQENLRAIEAGGLVIAPPWDVPKGSMPVIIIEPSTGFGTGHHATTRLCLQMLQTLARSDRSGPEPVVRGARVLDVGTGSGVLALAAWKLGASEVVAIDNDPDALENARDNIARNGAGPSIDIISDDLGGLRIERANIVLANLTGAVLVRYASELAALAVAGGYLILSGFAPQDAAVVRAAFRELTAIDESSEGEWAVLCLRSS